MKKTLTATALVVTNGASYLAGEHIGVEKGLTKATPVQVSVIGEDAFIRSEGELSQQLILEKLEGMSVEVDGIDDVE